MFKHRCLKRLPYSPPGPSPISLEDGDEELPDHVDNASSYAAIEFQSSLEKESVPHLTLKISYNRGEDSDVGRHISDQCSPSPDKPNSVASCRQSNYDSPILISDVSGNGASPQVNKDSKQIEAQAKPPLKLSRSQKSTPKGDSSICMNFEKETSTPSGSKGVKYFEAPPGDKAEQQRKSMANVLLRKEQVISSNSDTGDSTQQDTTVNEYIEKVIEWFPDGCRMWIKKRIENIMHRGKEVHLDDLAISMVDGLYPKSSQNEADDNNGIKSSPSARGK